MRIRSYQYSDESWEFERVELGHLNVIVGDSASGKTRFLNTLFNAADAATLPLQGMGVRNRRVVSLEHDGQAWLWELHLAQNEGGGPQVVQERLHVEGGGADLVSRTLRSFKFKGDELPRMATNSTALALLGEEPQIKLVRKAFRMLRRDFAGDGLNLPFKVGTLSIPVSDLVPAGSEAWWGGQVLPIHQLVQLLEMVDPERFRLLKEAYIAAFTFVDDIVVKDMSEVSPLTMPGPTPVVCIKERGSRSLIPAFELSSGMKKVLLLLTDLCTLPDGWMYLIDEYENSLGISAIDAFPAFLSAVNRDLQILITSHHPYLINRIPPEHWLVFSRKGAKVSIRGGAANLERYGRSRQQRFVQLMNDPFYSGRRA